MSRQTTEGVAPSGAVMDARASESEEALVHLASVLRGLLAAGLAVVVVGTVIALLRSGELPTMVSHFHDLPGQLASFDTGAVLSLGVLVFLFAPMLMLVYLVSAFLRSGDRLYTLIAGTVLVILLGSIVAASFANATAPPDRPELTIAREVVVLLVALVGGVLGSMLGLGGGVFITPILVGFVGIPIKIAIAASAVCVIVNSIGGTSLYLKHRMTNVRLTLLMELTTTLGAIVGGFVVVYIAGNLLRAIFGIALLGMAFTMFRRQRQTPPVTNGPDPLRLGAVFHDPAAGEDVPYIPRRAYGGGLLVAVAGVLSGLLGIGGGAVNVPIMNTLMRVPVKAATATSVMMVGITISASAFIYYIHSLLDLSVAIPAIMGVFLGSQVGPRVSRRLKNATLVRVLVLILIYLAINLLLQAAGIKLPGASK